MDLGGIVTVYYHFPRLEHPSVWDFFVEKDFAVGNWKESCSSYFVF